MTINKIKLFHLVLRACLLPLAAILLYLLSALILGLLPRHGDWQPASGGVDIYLENNGVHSAIIMPAATADMDWRQLFPPAQATRQERVKNATHVSVSWGSRVFFLQIQEWADLTPGKALSALALDNSVLHVEHLPAPHESADVRKIPLSVQQYRQLIGLIRAATPTGADGRALQIAGAHYYGNDAFYAGIGRYSPLSTCNEWTRRMLSAIGVRTPVWSPFVQPLFWQLPPAAPR